MTTDTGSARKISCVVDGPLAATCVSDAPASHDGVELVELAPQAFDLAAVERLEAAHVLVFATDATYGLPVFGRERIKLARQLGVRNILLAIEGEDAGSTGAVAEIGVIADNFQEFAQQLEFEHAEVVVLPSLDHSSSEIAERIRQIQIHHPAVDGPLRLAVSAAAKEDDGWLVKGRILSGGIASGARAILMPEAEVVTVTVADASDGEYVVRLNGGTPRPGQVLSSFEDRPEITDQVAAHIIWLGRAPMLPGRHYDAVVNGTRTGVQVSTLKHRISPDTMEPIAARSLRTGQLGLVNLSFDENIVFDPHAHSRHSGRAAIVDPETGETVGVALIDFALRRATNIHWQALAVDRAARSGLLGQKPACLWFTGLSGSGKSTVASLLEKRLHALDRLTYTLDGDNVRHGLNRDLGFTDADRVENVRRVGEVAKLFVDAGLIVMVSFISPFRAERELARSLMDDGEFIEIFVNTPLEICEQRDPKGLYKKARAGQLKNFTGIDSAYEPPEEAEIELAGGIKPAEALVEDVLAELERRGVLKSVIPALRASA